MKKIIVIGAGVAGTFTCLRLLQKGYFVSLVSPTTPSKKLFSKENTFSNLVNKVGGLKQNFKKFYYNSMDNIDLDSGSVIFKYPVGRKLFSEPSSILNSEVELRCKSFEYLASDKLFGLGAGWGANVRKFDGFDISDWPLDLKSLYKFDGEASKYFHWKNSKKVHATRSKLKERLAAALNGFAELSDSKLAIDERKCVDCGLCIWGCSHDAIFSPIDIYVELKKNKNFNHIDGFAESIDGNLNQAEGVWVRQPSKEIKFISADDIVLSGGPLSSFSLLSDFICKTEGIRKISSHLMDTTCIKVPVIDFSIISTKYSQNRVMFNDFTFDWCSKHSDVTIQGEVMKLNALLLSGLLLQKPLNSIFNFLLLKTLIHRLFSITLFMSTNTERSAKIKFEVNECKKIITISGKKSAYEKKIFVNFQWKLFKKMFAKCYFLIPKSMSETSGSGIHYAGTIPMKKTEGFLCSVDKFGRHHKFRNLWVSDSSTFPSLPSKSLTYTIACNAMRIADNV